MIHLPNEVLINILQMVPIRQNQNYQNLSLVNSQFKECIVFILTRGSHPRLIAFQEDTRLVQLVYLGVCFPSVLQFFIDKNKKFFLTSTFTTSVVRHGTIEMLRKITSLGAQVNETDGGSFPLLNAMFSFEKSKYLIECGARLNTLNASIVLNTLIQEEDVSTLELFFKHNMLQSAITTTRYYERHPFMFMCSFDVVRMRKRKKIIQLLEKYASSSINWHGQNNENCWTLNT